MYRVFIAFYKIIEPLRALTVSNSLNPLLLLVFRWSYVNKEKVLCCLIRNTCGSSGEREMLSENSAADRRLLLQLSRVFPNECLIFILNSIETPWIIHGNTENMFSTCLRRHYDQKKDCKIARVIITSTARATFVLSWIIRINTFNFENQILFFQFPPTFSTYAITKQQAN